MLQIELSPIYDSVNTWKEFADALHEKYDKTEDLADNELQELNTINESLNKTLFEIEESFYRH